MVPTRTDCVEDEDEEAEDDDDYKEEKKEQDCQHVRMDPCLSTQVAPWRAIYTVTIRA